jgi:hypothetical protein
MVRLTGVLCLTWRKHEEPLEKKQIIYLEIDLLPGLPMGDFEHLPALINLADFLVFD